MPNPSQIVTSELWVAVPAGRTWAWVGSAAEALAPKGKPFWERERLFGKPLLLLMLPQLWNKEQPSAASTVNITFHKYYARKGTCQVSHILICSFPMHSWTDGLVQSGCCSLYRCKARSRGSLRAISFVVSLEEADVLFPEKYPPKEGVLYWIFFQKFELWKLARRFVCLVIVSNRLPLDALFSFLCVPLNA